MEKYQRSNSVQNPQDEFVQSLLDVLHSKGLSNSLKKLGAFVGGSKDGERGFVETNTEGLLKALVDRLVSSNDYKIMEMGMRHEIKLEVNETFKGECQHNYSTVREDRVFALLVNWDKDEILTFAELQSHLDKAMKYEENEACTVCGISAVKTVQCSVKEFCDPDFLTIVFKKPVNFNAELNGGNVSNYGASLYMVKTVVQWDAAMRGTSVSREKEGGWWWHGVDESQGSDFKYCTEEMHSSAHLKNLTVMMMRIGERCDQPVTCQNVQNLNTNKSGKTRNETRDERTQNLNNLSRVSSKGSSSGDKVSKKVQVEIGEDCQRKSLKEVSTLLMNTDNGRKDTVVAPFLTNNDQLESDLALAKALSLRTERNAEESQFQQNLALAQVLSLRDTPNLLTPEEVVRKGIAYVAWNLKILCRRPGIHIKLDGNCLWTCICHVIDPNLRGEALEQEAWELRVKSMGASIEQLKDMTDEGWQWLQTVSVKKDDEEPLTRDEIKSEMDKYMNSGIYEGNLGDILPQSAASHLGQPILIIEINDGKVTNANLVKPGMIFQCENEEDEPFILVKQKDHFIPLLVDEVARETAREMYRRWKTSERVNIVGQSSEVGNDGEMRHGAESNKRVDQSKENSTKSDDKRGHESQMFNGVFECNCGFKGAIANHFRTFQHCLQSIRNELSLGNEMPDDVLIVKATLLLQGCPALSCPEGNHDVLPESCVQWWKKYGFDLMQWEERIEDINSTLIKEKARKFVTDLTEKYDEQKEDVSQTVDDNSNKSQLNGNMEQRTMDATMDEIFSPPVASTPNQQRQSNFEQEQPDISAPPKDTCPICHFEGCFAQHLKNQNPCLALLIEKELKNRVAFYKGKCRLAIFDLGILLSFCPNPLCSKRLSDEGVTKHARGDCLQFYQSEGESLYKWDRNLTSGSLAAKWRNRKSWLKKCVREEAENKLCNYLNSLAMILTKVCSNCCVQGPLLGIKEHELEIAGWNDISNRPLWLCGSCRDQSEKHLEMVRLAEERVTLLSKARPKEESALRAVEIEDSISLTSRVVFMPADLAGENSQRERDELLPVSSTVLVPINPEALDQFSDEIFEEANNDKNALASLTEFSARRPFFVKPTLLLSLFWRMKQAQIRLERLSMLKSLQKTAKGKITSRNPNIANVVGRNPHYAATQRFCLTTTCSWSSGAEAKRSDESAARSSINGQVKTWVRITLLKQGAECPELTRVVKAAVDAHGPRPPIYLAPLVMRFVYGKLKLLMKHILAPAYNNWDLHLRFHPREWTVEVVGYLYSQQFEKMNVQIAQHGLTHEDIIKETLTQQALMPTVCLDVKKIAEIYSLDEERAQVRNIFEI